MNTPVCFSSHQVNAGLRMHFKWIYNKKEEERKPYCQIHRS